jgi:hypothetical protein
VVLGIELRALSVFRQVLYHLILAPSSVLLYSRSTCSRMGLALPKVKDSVGAQFARAEMRAGTLRIVLAHTPGGGCPGWLCVIEGSLSSPVRKVNQRGVGRSNGGSMVVLTGVHSRG